MKASIKSDKAKPSELNARSIRNLINQDIFSHNKIMYKDLASIEGLAEVFDRNQYMTNWATDSPSHFTRLSYTDEVMRLLRKSDKIRSKHCTAALLMINKSTRNSSYTISTLTNTVSGNVYRRRLHQSGNDFEVQ